MHTHGALKAHVTRSRVLGVGRSKKRWASQSSDDGVSSIPNQVSRVHHASSCSICNRVPWHCRESALAASGGVGAHSGVSSMRGVELWTVVRRSAGKWSPGPHAIATGPHAVPCARRSAWARKCAHIVLPLIDACGATTVRWWNEGRTNHGSASERASVPNTSKADAGSIEICHKPTIAHHLTRIPLSCICACGGRRVAWGFQIRTHQTLA